MTAKPIFYEYNVDVRFAELDRYGHVNLSHYLDIIVTSRWLYLERVLKIPLSDTLKQGVAFYTAKAEQEFLKPITGLQSVRVKSFVERVEGSRIFIPYEMKDSGEKILFSKGLLEFAVVDLKTGKPCELPPAVRGYFFEKE